MLEKLKQTIDELDGLKKDAERERLSIQQEYRCLFNSIRDSILVADTERNIIDFNSAFAELFEYTWDDLRGKKTVFVYENEEQFLDLGRAIQNDYGGRAFLYTVNYRTKSGRVFPGETGVYFLRDEQGNTTGFIGLIRDISERLRVEQEKELLIEQLQKALNEVRTLSGMLPICASCKKIRDDQGYWQHLERYIGDRTNADFTHGICPDCEARLYPDFSNSE